MGVYDNLFSNLGDWRKQRGYESDENTDVPKVPVADAIEIGDVNIPNEAENDTTNSSTTGYQPVDYLGLWNEYAKAPISEQEQKDRTRRANAVNAIGHLGNVIGAFANVIGTSNGAVSQNIPAYTGADVGKWNDKIDAQRLNYANGQMSATKMTEDEKRNYLNYLLNERKIANQERNSIENARLKLMEVEARIKKTDAQTNKEENLAELYSAKRDLVDLQTVAQQTKNAYLESEIKAKLREIDSKINRNNAAANNSNSAAAHRGERSDGSFLEGTSGTKITY